VEEKLKRNQALWDYHVKHPNTGGTKLGRIFKLSPSTVWRILKRMEKRSKEWCPQHGYPTPCNKCGYTGKVGEVNA
jgi:hypothetical protein